MNYEVSNKPTFWVLLLFWFRELVIFAALVIMVSVSFAAFFFLPEGYLTQDFLTLLFY